MAGHRAPVVDDVKRVRRQISRRLWKAQSEGRLHEELLTMGRAARRAFRDAVNGRRKTNGRARRGRR